MDPGNHHRFALEVSTVANENENSAVTAEMSPLLDLAHETGVALILVHHERKSGGEAGRGIRGASSLFAAADHFVARSPSEEHRKPTNAKDSRPV
jgi:hypothetical protein